MTAALYEPDLGYYMTDRPIFGAAGDFMTAPEMSPLVHALPRDRARRSLHEDRRRRHRRVRRRKRQDGGGARRHARPARDAAAPLSHRRAKPDAGQPATPAGSSAPPVRPACSIASNGWKNRPPRNGRAWPSPTKSSTRCPSIAFELPVMAARRSVSSRRPLASIGRRGPQTGRSWRRSKRFRDACLSRCRMDSCRNCARASAHGSGPRPEG